MGLITNSLFVLAGLIAAGAAEAGEPDLAIRGVTIISPERTYPVRRADVFIEDGKIAAIEPSRRHRAAASEINGEGRYLIPGLIDSHVHLYHASGLKRRYTADFDRLYAQYEAQLPRSALYFGYTTLVELNADEATNRQFEQASPRPDLYHCGQGLVVSNDFMATDFGDEAEFLAAFPNFLHDRFTTPELPAGFDPADHTPAATVEKIAASGGRCVKLYYEEALCWPGDDRPAFALPSEAIAKEVVTEAHRRNMPVLLHGTTPAAYRFAAATGVDILAHGLWDWEGASDGSQEIPKEAYATLSAVTSAHVAVQPTLQTVKGALSMFDPTVLDDPSLGKVLPADYIDYLHTDGQKARDLYLRIFGPRIADNYAQGKAASDDIEVIVRAYFDRAVRLLRRAHRAKTRLLFGTDTAVGGFGWGNPPGLNGYWEMQDWERAGVPLKAIFKAATIENARAFGLDKQIGSVEVGKEANLLLLSANPLKDIHAYNSIETVIVHGEAIKRSALSADAQTLH